MTLAIPFPAIDPVLIELGPLQIRWYALAYLGGILLGWWYMGRLTQNTVIYGGMASPVRPAHVDDLLFFATLGIVLGGRLGYVFFYKPGYYLENPGEILQVWQGGMSFHGGAIGLLIACALVARYKKISMLALGDLAAAAAPIGLFSAASPTSSMANCGAGFRMCRGPWCFRSPAPNRATPASFIRRHWKASHCSSSCAC
jgi:phosphatidylglycerol:prolipoprotein diacylglycerol transferase